MYSNQVSVVGKKTRVKYHNFCDLMTISVSVYGIYNHTLSSTRILRKCTFCGTTGRNVQMCSFLKVNLRVTLDGLPCLKIVLFSQGQVIFEYRPWWDYRRLREALKSARVTPPGQYWTFNFVLSAFVSFFSFVRFDTSVSEPSSRLAGLPPPLHMVSTQ